MVVSTKRRDVDGSSLEQPFQLLYPLTSVQWFTPHHYYDMIVFPCQLSNVHVLHIYFSLFRSLSPFAIWLDLLLPSCTSSISLSSDIMALNSSSVNNFLHS